MKTVVLRVAFDGTNYSGMQNQRSAPSVQQELERAMRETIGYHCHVIAAGRTDAGVHARGMVVHARVRDDWGIEEHKIKVAINSRLPKDIRVTGAQLRGDDLFHARFDATGRAYSYTLQTREDPLHRLYAWQTRYVIDEEVLTNSASIFLGVHNFTTFSKNNEEIHSYICTVETCKWEKIHGHEFRLHIKANRFVYGMVRSLVGAMVDAARGKRSIDDLRTSLAACDRRFVSPLAPAEGLVFEAATYPDELHVEFV